MDFSDSDQRHRRCCWQREFREAPEERKENAGGGARGTIVGVGPKNNMAKASSKRESSREMNSSMDMAALEMSRHVFNIAMFGRTTLRS